MVTKPTTQRSVLVDEDYSGNDDHIDACKALVRKYQALHDGLSDMIENGRLTKAAIPDDYRWLVESLAKLAIMDGNAPDHPDADDEA